MLTPTQPLVTVICTCHNHEMYLVDALNSVKNQSYRNVEIIIVDNASTDNSVNAIMDWIGENEINFIRNTENIGLNKSFNQALKISKGEYIVDFATDDLLLPNSINEQITYFNQNDRKDLGVVFSNMERIDDHGNHISYLYPVTENGHAKNPPSSGNIYKQLIHSFFVSACTMMIKREVLNTLNGYDEKLAYEDLDFWVRSSRDYEYGYVDLILVQKRIHKMAFSLNFKNKRGIDLDASTYLVCLKAFKLNKSKHEHIALLNRVKYHMRWAVKNRRLATGLRFYKLLVQIRMKIKSC